MPDQGTGPGSTPRAALQQMRVAPIPFRIAKQLLVREHYLHSMPGGSRLSLGVFLGGQLLGAVLLGAGPSNAHRMVEGGDSDSCLTLTRLWLDNSLPRNSESRVLGVIFRHLRRSTAVKFLVSYADPAAGHIGTIYQASNWLYAGLSQAVPWIDLGDGVPRHSRSVAHSYGTHGRAHFAAHGIELQRIPQSPKHRYIRFLDPTWRSRLRVPVLPYPKRGEPGESD